MALVEMQAVSRHYRLGAIAVAALNNIDLTVERGEFVAVWGPSGSGKSTLCHLLGGIDVPTSGTVLVNGRNMALMSDDERSEHRNRSVGFIFQQFNLVPVLSAVENVMMPLTLRGENTARARARALALLDELGIAEFGSQRPDQLSGGQRQRVAVARALITDPPLVIADEPTANLDSENATMLVNLMRTLHESNDVSFVFSTHDRRLLERVDRRIRLHDGRITEDEVIGSTPARTGDPDV